MATSCHFRDKDQLIGAVAAEGFRRLTAALRDGVAAGKGDFREELRLCGRGYIAFALANPEHLKVMFSSHRFLPDHTCIHSMEDLDAFTCITDVFKRAQQKRLIHANRPPQALAMVAWSQVHGLSHILIEEQVPPGTMSGEEVLSLIDFQADLMCRGLGLPDVPAG